MKILKNLICTFVAYSMAFATPAAGASSNAASDFKNVKSYLNSKGKKNYKSFLMKMEKSLPSNFYEESMKSMKGELGKGFFDSAKITNRYAYFRFDGSKILVRFKTKNGKIVFIANGIEINEGDFKNMKIVYGKLFRAHIKGRSNKRKKTQTSFLNLISWNQAFAEDTPDADGAKGRFSNTVFDSDASCGMGTLCGCDRSYGALMQTTQCKPYEALKSSIEDSSGEK